MYETGVWPPEIDRVSERMLLPGVGRGVCIHTVMGKGWPQQVAELRVQPHTDTGESRFGSPRVSQEDIFTPAVLAADPAEVSES